MAIGIGTAVLYKEHETDVNDEYVANIDSELSRFDYAIKLAEDKLLEIEKQTEKEAGKDEALVFFAQRMLLKDPEYAGAIKERIVSSKIGLASAIKKVEKEMKEQFKSLDSDLIKERIEDIKDVSDRLLRIVSGQTEKTVIDGEDIILLVNSISPSEFVELNKTNIKGIVFKNVTRYSHVGILANAVGIPALFNYEFSDDIEGKKVIIDTAKNALIQEFSKETLDEFILRQKDENTENKEAYMIEKVYANVNDISDIKKAVDANADGIGLLRSEFIYMNSKDLPTEEDQFEIYKKAASSFGEKPVYIRTFDLGSDKKADSIEIPDEKNPAMGYRGVRIAFDHEDILKTQLRAILRATAYGNIGVMFPMIISLEEVVRLKEIVKKTEQELKNENVKISDIKIGVMVETPAAVMLSDELSKEVDFISIGTNDLTQYTLAADRENPKVGKYYDIHHKAVLKMIELVAETAKENGCKVCVCGELAGESEWINKLVSLGINEISVSTNIINRIKK